MKNLNNDDLGKYASPSWMAQPATNTNQPTGYAKILGWNTHGWGDKPQVQNNYAFEVNYVELRRWTSKIDTKSV